MTKETKRKNEGNPSSCGGLLSTHPVARSPPVGRGRDSEVQK